jgi:predicted Zn-dependent protease
MKYSVMLLLFLFACRQSPDKEKLKQEIISLDLKRGEIALCGSENAMLGKVSFGLSCSEKVQADFNTATALLHSFEYAEAEKIFAKVIDEDPECVMAYWGVAMSNFHPLWAPPTNDDLKKGAATIKVARSLESNSQREVDYLEATAALYDDWEKLNHRERLLKFENKAHAIYQKYPDDKEAAIFYALALRAAADPTDQTFVKQKKAGEILTALFQNNPDHPGVAHYLIHTYDYPELASLGLPAARKYAAIAATSAHALHMPSHIFTRLGLWDEAIKSNLSSISAAKCYAENAGMKGHWDEELHGLDYLVYAYLQEGNDAKASEYADYLTTIDEVFPYNNKVAYTFAAVPTRIALERKDWKEAKALSPKANVPWEKFPWERSMIAFGRALGAVHLKDLAAATQALEELRMNQKASQEKNPYEANQVMIQIKATEGWIAFLKGDPPEAIKLMTESADMEDATEKHPVTPGEVLPARELLGDLYSEMKDYPKALEAYESDLKRHPERLNGLIGAAHAAKMSGDQEKAAMYGSKLKTIAEKSDRKSL